MTNNPSWNRRLRPFYLADAHTHAHARHTTTHTMPLFPRPLSGALQCSATAGEIRVGRVRCWGVFWNPPALAPLPSPSINSEHQDSCWVGRVRCWGVFWNPPALAPLPSPSTSLPLPTPHQIQPFPRPLSGALQCSATAVGNDTETITHSLTLVRSRGLPRPRTPARPRALPPSSGCRRGRRFGLRASRNRETRSRRSRPSRLRYALRPVAPAPPPKSGVRSVLRTQRAFLSATAGTIPRKTPLRALATSLVPHLTTAST